MTFDEPLSRRSLLRGALAAVAGLAAGRLGASTPAAAASAGARAARWMRLGGSLHPGARRDHSLTPTGEGGAVYLFGGRRNGVAANDLWALDPKKAAWRRVEARGPKPPPRFGHDAFYDAARKRLVVAMGQASSGSFFNDVWAFDPAASSWRQLGVSSAMRPEVRYGAAGAYDRGGNRLFISHGFTSQGRFDDTWILDLATESWSKLSTEGRVPVKRCLTRAFWDPAGRRILLFGGQTDGNPYLGDFWSLDVGRGVWMQERQAALPSARNLYGASFDEARRRWYVVGGATAKGPAGDAWVYDAAREAWSVIKGIGSKPSARSALDVAVAGGRLYLFGGNDGTRDLDDTWVLALP